MELPQEAKHRTTIYTASEESQENNMSILSPNLKFESLNWVASSPQPRDRTQSHRLHEPTFRICTTDPMTGHDNAYFMNHPSITDGNLTIYFDTEATRKAYEEIPLDHPNEHLPFPASDEDDRGG